MIKIPKLNFGLANIKTEFLRIAAKAKEPVLYLRDRVAIHPDVMFVRLRLLQIFPPLSNHFFKIVFVIFLLIPFYFSFFIFSWRAPSNFPEHALVTVGRGDNFGQIAEAFEKAGVIRSAAWLKFFVRITGGDRRVVTGDYYFPDPVSIFKVVRVLHKGEFGLIAERVTLYEGLDSYEIGDVLAKTLPAFNRDEFINEVESSGYEGTLFPDTYFFMPNTSPKDIILSMRENFARQIKPFEEDIAKSGKTLSDIIIMASIIEGEANNQIESKRIVSGILWKRLRLEMPLQVDAPFKYYNDKNSYTLTKDDLKEDHPYNTYVNKGLPPTPINNPGLDSIRAAIAPTNTDYLYFMSDKNGNMYYARDFDGHQANRERYLR